jgi:hypothetical protein
MGTMTGGPLPAITINIDGCVPTSGSTLVSWSGLAETVASVQVRYVQGDVTAPSDWVNLRTATKSGSVSVSPPSQASTGTWNVDKVVLATKRNGVGVLSERPFDCVTPVADTTEPTYVIQTIAPETTTTVK